MDRNIWLVSEFFYFGSSCIYRTEEELKISSFPHLARIPDSIWKMYEIFNSSFKVKTFGEFR